MDWKLFDSLFVGNKKLDPKTYDLVDGLIKSDLPYEELVSKVSEYLPPDRYDFGNPEELI